MSVRAYGCLVGLALAACTSDPIDQPPPPRYEPCCTPDPEDPPDVCFAHLEIEEFSGPWNVQRNIAPFYGQGFATSPSAGVADTVMRAEVKLTAGRYVVWTRGFRDFLPRDWRVSVNGSTLAATHQAFGGAPGYVWVRAGEVDVDAELAEVVVHDVGESFEVADAIAMSSDLDYDPHEDEDAWRVIDVPLATTMMKDSVLDRMARTRADIPVAATAQAFERRREEVRARVLESMGLLETPTRNDLDAQIVGTIELDGYRIEKLRCESRPGIIVTAHVYVPEGPGPFPVVVSPIGHYYAYAKASPYVAPRAHGLAKLGFASLVYDAFGQGERDVGGHSHDEGWRLGLTGHSNLSIMVWDTMRAIDYLETRSDIDTSRIAVTGASGGGLNSLYTSIADERISASLPVVYVTGFEDIVDADLLHDACTYQWGVAGYTNMGEMAGLFAPKPQLMMAGDRDPLFPSDGTLRQHDQATQIYALYDADEDVRVFVAQSDHEYHLSMRERLYGFVTEHFGPGDGAPIPEPAFTLPNPADSNLRVYERGYIDTPETPRSLAQRWAEDAIAALPPPEQVSVTALRTAIESTLLPRKIDYVPEVTEVAPYVTASGESITRLRFDVDPGIALGGFIRAAGPGAPVVVVVDGGGITRPEPILARAPEDVTLVYVAPRGDGESSWNEDLATNDYYMLGEALLAQRALDIAKVRRALRSYPATADSAVGLLALGEHAALYAAFAQAMYLEYDAVALGPVMTTFMETFLRTVPAMTRVFGLLEHADMPQVLWLAGEQPMSVVLANDVYRQYAGPWVGALDGRVRIADDASFDAGVAWLTETLN